MANENEEIKFPLEFTQCPSCGSTKRIAAMLLEKEKEKGKAGKDTTGIIQTIQAIIADPRHIVLSAPVVMALVDICADCGTLYCILAQTGTATPGPARGKGQNLMNFGFPQGPPNLS